MRDKCKISAAKISAYQDGELPFAEKREIEKHLKTCDECRQLLGEFGETKKVALDILSEMTGEGIDLNHLWEEMEGDIKCGPGSERRLAGWIWRPMVWIPTAVAVAAAFVFFVAPFPGEQAHVGISSVESVYSSKGMVMVLKTSEGGPPIIWILADNGKEAGT